KKWEGIKDATSYGMVCPLMMPENPQGEMFVPHMYWPQNEHCQTVNIWTQHIDNKAKKPVMVWLHGGGFFAGSSIEQLAYDGANLSQFGDVVVVSLNHRLNILGFLDLSPFGEKYKNSANVGLADIVEALRWVKENIEEFGGDPENITLFGQSGGGMKITALMQIPDAEGLFQRGIVMSGVAGDFMPPCQGDGTAIVNAMLEVLNETDVEKLEKIPYEQLLQVYFIAAQKIQAMGGYVGNNPRIDDYYLGEPQMTEFTNQAKNTPLMVGTVFGEMSFAPVDYNKNKLSEEEMIEMIRDKFKDKTEDIIEAFHKAYPHKKIVDVLSIDTLFRPTTKQLVQAKSKYQQAPTYSYLFSLEFPCQNDKVAWHCSDIPFVFHNIDKVPVTTIPGVSEVLQDQICQAIVSFAYTGNPNHSGLPHWSSCRESDEFTMIFDRTCEVRHNFDTELMKILKEVLPKISIADLLASAT
ncbi:MAG: carboxylesterase family protein, partial [Coprobacillus sp.]